MAVAEIIGVLLVLALVTVGVAVLAVINELVGPAEDQRRRRSPTWEAEQEIRDIGQWEQQALMAELQRRTQQRRQRDRLSPEQMVIDGDVLHVQDEPDGSQW